jgi:hypothetical protein
MAVGTRAAVLFQAPIIISHCIVDLALNDHLLAVVAVDAAAAFLLIVERHGCGMSRLVRPERRRVPALPAGGVGVGRPVPRRAGRLGLSCRVDGRELEIATRVVAVVRGLLGVGRHLIHAYERT